MIDITDYINAVLEKKGWNRARLCSELNVLEKRKKIPLTYKQHITNYLNSQMTFSKKTLLKWETVLGLPFNSLAAFICTPTSKKEINKLKEYSKFLRDD